MTMRTVGGWVLAISVTAALGAGCASHERPDGDGNQTEQQDDSSRQVRDDCAARIDAQIASREIPNADRDYAFGMCVASR